MAHGHDHALGHGHDLAPRRQGERRTLARALALIVTFMAVEVIAGLLASSLALLSDAAHMLTDAAALALALAAARIAGRPPGGSLTYGLGRAEVLSAQANGVTLLVLGGVIVAGAVDRLISPPAVNGTAVLIVALAGITVNLLCTRILAAGSPDARSLNLQGSLTHLLSDLFGFLATAAAAGAILLFGFRRADPIASLLVAAVMLSGSYSLLKRSGRVFMEAAPAGLEPEAIGRALAGHPGVVEVHDLHVWELTAGFPALSAHVVVGAQEDCHERRRGLERLLDERFGIRHTTLQVDHEAAEQSPLQIEVTERARGAR